jgi:hypothetical protein
MRMTVPTLILAALALAGCAQSPADIARSQAREQASQDALGKKLAGLTATETKDCLDQYNSTSVTAYGATLVYQVTNSLMYVNRTNGGCEAIERGDILVTRSPTGRLCRGDIGTTVMPGSRTQSGSCSLGSFTTYRKLK